MAWLEVNLSDLTLLGREVTHVPQREEAADQSPCPLCKAGEEGEGECTLLASCGIVQRHGNGDALWNVADGDGHGDTDAKGGIVWS